MSNPTAAQTSPLRLLEPAPRLYIPLCAHETVDPPPPLEPGSMVAKGDAVSQGLAEGGPAALAPTSGRIVGVSRVLLTNGRCVPAVELESDFQDRSGPEEHDAHPAAGQREGIESFDKASGEDFGPWIDRLRAAGVWADRPHSPDLLGQLHQALRRPIDTLICNLVDHEPALRLGSMMAGRFGPVLITGMTLLARLTGARRVWIAVEAGTALKWWLPLRRGLRKASAEIVPVRADYPRGDPTLLIHALLRRRLRPGRSPVEQGVLMLDGVSAIAIGRAAARGQPMLQTPFAVRDHLHGKSHLLVVRIGTTIGQVLDHLHLPRQRVSLLRGDILRDQAIGPDAVIAGGELTLHVMPEREAALSDPCIRCGWCAQACPTIVQPAGLLEAAQRQSPALADRYGLGACVECGICDFVCPSRLPLLRGIRALKKMMRQ